MVLVESLSSSALQRSKTAPTPLVESPTVQRDGNPNTGVGIINNRSVISRLRTKPTLFHHYTRAGDDGSPGPGAGGLEELIVEGMAARTHPSLVSPRHDIRDNPFNLAGFFPSRPGSPDHPVEWARRGTIDETETRAYAYTATDAENEENKKERKREGATEWGNVVSVRSLSVNALDEYAREVIAGESNKLGILGIARVPSFFRSIRDSYFGTLEAEEEEEEEEHESEQSENINVLMFEEEYAASPTIDEPFDAETLCELIHSRRMAAERETTGEWERVPSLGLFGAVGVVEESVEASDGWASGLYTKLLGPEV